VEADVLPLEYAPKNGRFLDCLGAICLLTTTRKCAAKIREKHLEFRRTGTMPRPTLEPMPLKGAVEHPTPNEHSEVAKTRPSGNG
jgi:hypothetical protein